MDLALSPDEKRFRDEVRHFLRDNLGDDLRDGQSLTAGVFSEPEISRPWHKILGARGWLTPLWPVHYGGTGWTGIERFIFETECALAGAPLVYPMGVRLVGPVIIAFGSEAHKSHYLPRILADEDYWCQGFSEPGAGSDLASLTTKANKIGEDYLVNGSKMWTTHAHHANKMFTLVRTDPNARKQDGISFLVIDMDTPGIEVRPIISIGGEHDVNQIFLDNVRVSQANRIGEEGKGWSYAKYLLDFERGAGLFSGRLRSSLKRIGQVLAARAAQGQAPTPDANLMAKLAEIAIDLDSFEFLELMTLGPLRPGENPGPISSVLKLRASQLKQAVTGIGVSLLGDDAALWPESIDCREDALVADYLNSRAATIFGGSKEIQLGIIARSLAGLS